MDTEHLLRQCKFSKRHQGYYGLQECVRIALADEECLLYVTGLYMDAAQKFRISWTGVERNIRTALNHSWNNGGREQLELLAGGKLYEKPTVSEVIEILACYLKEHQEPDAHRG